MTTEEIYNQIIAEKESGNYPELDELNSTSKVSIWRLWVWIFSYFTVAIQTLFDELKVWMQEYFERKQVGTLRWWIDTVKAFQYGDSLNFINGIYQYPTIDETKKIIAQAALEVYQGILNFKVAKLVNNELSPISAEEKTALKAYINQIKLVGQFIDVVSLDADLIQLSLRIYYNAQYSTTDLRTEIEAVITDYMQNIVFNGEFIVTALIDKIQSVEGILNPVFVSGQYKNANFTEWQILLGDYFRAVSGYFKLDAVNLEFVPYVQN